MPGNRWRRVPVKHEEIVRSGLYCSSLSLPVIFSDPPSPTAEINFSYQFASPKQHKIGRENLRFIDFRQQPAWRTFGILRFIKIVAINHKRRVGVIISDLGDAGKSLLEI